MRENVQPLYAGEVEKINAGQNTSDIAIKMGIPVMVSINTCRKIQPAVLQTLGFAFGESEVSFASQCVFTTLPLGEEAVESMGGPQTISLNTLVEILSLLSWDASVNKKIESRLNNMSRTPFLMATTLFQIGRAHV